jgi:hypothetical protein
MEVIMIPEKPPHVAPTDGTKLQPVGVSAQRSATGPGDAAKRSMPTLQGGMLQDISSKVSTLRASGPINEALDKFNYVWTKSKASAVLGLIKAAGSSFFKFITDAYTKEAIKELKASYPALQSRFETLESSEYKKISREYNKLLQSDIQYVHDKKIPEWAKPAAMHQEAETRAISQLTKGYEDAHNFMNQIMNLPLRMEAFEKELEGFNVPTYDGSDLRRLTWLLDNDPLSLEVFTGITAQNLLDLKKSLDKALEEIGRAPEKPEDVHKPFNDVRDAIVKAFPRLKPENYSKP